MNLIECYMKNSKCYKETTIGKPVGILFHDTSAGNPYIKRYVQPPDNSPSRDSLISILGKNQYGNDYEHKMDSKGLNAFIGKLADGSVATVQCQPWIYRPWGVGRGTRGSLNGSTNGPFWIQFEICDDGYKSKEYFTQVYNEAIDLCVMLCEKFEIDPYSMVSYAGYRVPTILCHKDAAALKLGSDHSDVYPWFSKFGKNMNDVRQDVFNKLSEHGTAPKDEDSIIINVPTEIVKDCHVEILSGATWYNGKKIPEWVMKTSWIVKSVKSDRAVLDVSTDGKHKDLCSPINTKYLKRIK